jgi:hypothetical protein
VGRIRDLIVGLMAEVPKLAVRLGDSQKDYQNDEIEELARSVMDYGRMRRDVLSQELIVVEVDDLAFRLRKTPRTITKALFLLEGRGRAKRTELEGLWELRT